MRRVWDVVRRIVTHDDSPPPDLDATLDLPDGYESWEREFVEAQSALRRAVAESHVPTSWH